MEIDFGPLFAAISSEDGEMQNLVRSTLPELQRADPSVRSQLVAHIGKLRGRAASLGYQCLDRAREGETELFDEVYTRIAESETENEEIDAQVQALRIVGVGVRRPDIRKRVLELVESPLQNLAIAAVEALPPIVLEPEVQEVLGRASRMHSHPNVRRAALRIQYGREVRDALSPATPAPAAVSLFVVPDLGERADFISDVEELSSTLKSLLDRLDPEENAAPRALIEGTIIPALDELGMLLANPVSQETELRGARSKVVALSLSAAGRAQGLGVGLLKTGSYFNSIWSLAEKVIEHQEQLPF